MQGKNLRDRDHNQNILSKQVLETFLELQDTKIPVWCGMWILSKGTGSEIEPWVQGWILFGAPQYQYQFLAHLLTSHSDNSRRFTRSFY
jgi:hypothetical protein